MAEAVSDASDLLALLKGEPGAETVEAEISETVISVVNLSEVVSKLVDGGMPGEAIRGALQALEVNVEPFGPEDAYKAGLLR